jgi:hypothetical protein
MPLSILHHIVQAFPFVVPGTLVVHIAKRSLNRIGPRTVWRQPEQRQTRGSCSPLLDGLHFMKTGVLRDNIQTRYPGSRLRGVQQGQEIAKPSMVFARAAAIQQMAWGERQGPSQRVLLVLAWGHPLFLRALWHPGRSNLRQQGEIACLRKDHHRMWRPLFALKPKTRQMRAPVRVVIFGHPLGPFPHPAHLVEPAAYGFR